MMIACSSNERKSFNVELVKVFKDEYGRMLTIHSQKDSCMSYDEVYEKL